MTPQLSTPPFSRPINYRPDTSIAMLAPVPPQLQVPAAQLRVRHLLDRVHLDALEGTSGHATTTRDHVGVVSQRDRDPLVSACTFGTDRSYITWDQADHLITRIASVQAQIPVEHRAGDVAESVREEILQLELRALAGALRALAEPVAVRLGTCVYPATQHASASAILEITRRCALPWLDPMGYLQDTYMLVDDRGVTLMSGPEWLAYQKRLPDTMTS